MRKNLLCILLCLCIVVSFMVFTVIDPSAVTEAGVFLGDANMDGQINIVDVSAIQLTIALLKNQESISKSNSDVDSDGRVSIIDGTYIQKKLALLIDYFPSENNTSTEQNTLSESNNTISTTEAVSETDVQYEYKYRTICNICGADITDCLVGHGKWHILERNEDFSYSNQLIPVPVTK